MKVAIFTIYSQNCGNRLQNYALQEVLGQMGAESVETLRRTRPAAMVTRAKRALRRMLKDDEMERFLRFDEERIVFSRDVVSAELVSPGLSERYDAFVIGSDQVWNPYFSFSSERDYLPFVPREKKIAYAASFGVARLAPEDARWPVADLVDGIPLVSMREGAGADLVRCMTGRDVPVVLDPTMLLPSDAWHLIARRPDRGCPEEAYCFKCIIGEDAFSERADALAQSRGLTMVGSHDPRMPVGPAEFVWLVSRASLVCTDSFHASVFATLFHRPLVIFERRGEGGDMSSRLDTLCETFGLEGHRICHDGFSFDRVFEEDWAAVDERLAFERARSLDWLKDALRQVGMGLHGR